MAASYLDVIYGDSVPPLQVMHRHRDHWAAVVALGRTGTNAPRTSSAGRLFDAVAAIVGLRDAVSYEGQAAIELEQRVSPSERGGYPVPETGATPLLDAGRELIRCVVEDVRAGIEVGRIAARFHYGLAAAVVRAVQSVAAKTGLGTAALSGGVFQNVVLLERVVAGLEAAGLRVLVHSRVPPNDGGISLGQAAIAAARDRAAANG
jgi:hydrogenase maturation protein HypF